MKLLFKSIVYAVLLFCISVSACANVTLNSLFSDNMVLQKGVETAIWGTADENEKITISFRDQMVSTITTNGKWLIKLKPLPYVTDPSVITITGKDTIFIRNVLVGEVWLCSGQSNMERQLGPRPPQPLITDWEKERDAASYPQIREYYVPLKYAAEEVNDVHNHWTVCSPQTVSDFSAVAYFFAKNLSDHLHVPVGIIFSAFGGTPAEDWTSKAALEANPALSDLVKNYNNKQEGYQPAGKLMSGLYNGMIHPLVSYSIKGVAWYQGESNNDRPKQYVTVLSNMIHDWRQNFGQGDFPFLIVQIAPHKDMKPELREAQLVVTKTVKNTALIVTTDCGDSADIHPPQKQPVGERLAIAAEGLAYGTKTEYEGPLYKSFQIKGSKIILHFTHTGKGLTGRGSTLKGFAIAGYDMHFIPATAVIKQKKVIVYHDKIAQPKAVRYGWANVPDVNLYNKEGLPASPFRTDTE